MDPRWLVLLMATTLFAGCTETGADEQDEAVGPQGSIDAPGWALGDHWTFENTPASGEMSQMQLVVSGDAGGDWTMDTDAPDVALYDARSPISYLGSIRKSDLAGSQGSDRVQYFDFPLEENKTWTTAWDGRTVQVRVVAVQAASVHLQATEDGRLYADYTYDPERRFFGHLDFYDENETITYAMKTTAHGSGFTGTVYRYDLLEPTTYEAAGAAEEHAELDLGDATEVEFTSVVDCGGAEAGQGGAIVTHRGQDDPWVPQFVMPTQDMVHSVGHVCGDQPGAVANDIVAVDPERIYDLEYGAVAQGGKVTVLVEPRILHEITVA